MVFVVDYLKMRHCRLAFEKAGVLTMVTRLMSVECNRDLEAVMNRMYMVCLMVMLQSANAILPMLVDEALLVMRLKTSFDSAHNVKDDVSIHTADCLLWQTQSTFCL